MRLVHESFPGTPQYTWPLLGQRSGAEVWVKHENHTPTGAFKVRGGIVYLDKLTRAEPKVAGLISATRGNHGQSGSHPEHARIHLEVQCAHGIAGSVSREHRGTIYGLTASATFLGNSLGPLTGGTIAAGLGIRWVFVVTTVLLAVNLVWVWFTVPELQDARALPP